MGFHSLVNTRYFSEAAIGWKKNGGRYTTAPHGSRDYYQFWEEQDKRCKYGYKVGDLWIPGRMYGYLNFMPISRVPDNVLMAALKERQDKRGKLSITNVEKTVGFPSFWEIDYEWWNLKHIAWNGGSFMGVNSPGGKHMCCLKTRGAGFSYKEAWDGIYNYNFIDGSKSYYFAGAEPYLVGDAIMDKVQVGLDWINQYSNYWKKNRQKKYTLMHQKASYMDDKGVEKGSMSEIIAQVVDKPGKTRGKRGRKATFEEGGSFPVLEPALEVCMGSMREGSVYVGEITVFGTGGETGPGIQGLEDIFNYPESWDMLAFNNVWDQGVAGTECGYFVPCWRANSWYMDKNGNVDIPGAVHADDIARAKKKKSPKPKALDRRKAEYPRTPAEALQRLNGNGFNIAEIDAQIRRLQTNKAMQNQVRHGKIISSDVTNSGVEFMVLPKDKARPIEVYPHLELGDQLEGCTSILERPYTDSNGNVPAEMYMGTFDAYYKEETEDTTSLFSAKIWKQQNLIDPSFNDLPVAWLTGRSKSLENDYNRFFNLLKFYNAKGQGEISGGGQGVFTYAKTHRMLQYLYHEPEMLHNKDIASKSAQNSYLMNMTADRKKLGLMYLEDWHMQIRGIDEKGNPIYNLHYIHDIAFLQEMRKHNPEKGNFDRISDAIIAMFMLKERKAIMVKTRRTNREFYSDQHVLFGDNDYSTGETTTSY